MSGKAFIDTNILIYLYSEDEPRKMEISLQAINSYDCVISTQVLNEFSNVCIKKLDKTIDEIKLAIEEIINSFSLTAIDKETIITALNIHKKYNYSYYDSLIAASALLSKCTHLLSEDLSDGQVIENQLKIVNIYRHNINEK
ncbi:twitching motility protein PilT [Campylobacterota bacterium]|nr:twitching motility protein PilT [Campylobacterota bacterium]